MEVSVICDRCHEVVEGVRAPEFTGGFYDATPNSPWFGFSLPGEKIVCDACMFADVRYQEIYGVHNGGVPLHS